MDDSFLNVAKQIPQKVTLQTVLLGVVVGVLVLAGLAAIVWGLFNLVRTSQVPVCVQPVDEKIASSSSMASRHGQIKVEIAGAVKQPGLYRVGWDTRVGEVVEKAGGLTKQADKKFIQQDLNLAQTVKDGQKIYIPFQQVTSFKEKLEHICSPSNNSAEKSVVDEENGTVKESCISINHASAGELQTINGIGEKRAAEIIQNRPFKQIEELVSKQALGESIFEKNRSQFCL